MSRKLLFLVALGAVLADSLRLPASPRGEYETKAGYLLNFVEFIEWPSESFPDTTSPVILGVIGQDPFGVELDKLQDTQISGRKLRIKRFKGALEFRGEETPGRRQDGLALKRAKKIADLRSCHMLFVSSSESNFLPLILKPLKGASVLTVSESEAFAREGGVINFLDGSDRVRIEINLDAAEQARLKISSKLLSLAKVIRTEHPDDKR
jgi:hypothetical protein